MHIHPVNQVEFMTDKEPFGNRGRVNFIDKII